MRGGGGHSTLKHVPHSFALMLHVNLLQTENSCQYHTTLCGRRILPIFRHFPSTSSTECICNYKIDNLFQKRVLYRVVIDFLYYNCSYIAFRLSNWKVGFSRKEEVRRRTKRHFYSPANFLCCCKQSRDSSSSLRENSTFQFDNP